MKPLVKTRVFIGLGSNAGNRIQNLQIASEKMAALENVKIINASSLYETSPWGKIDQEDFINQVIELETDLSARELLYKLQEIEINMGRQRQVKWGPRNIDLDILWYGDEVIDLPELKIPHPYMCERLFVLIPLQEIEAELIFPDGTRIEEVLGKAEARDRDNLVKRI